MSDTKKAPIDLIPLRALVGAARVLEHGNTKKDRKPGDFIDRPLDGVFYASLLRHTMDLQRLQGGVDFDTLAALDVESGLPVIDHIITNLLILRTMLIRDDVLPEDPRGIAEVRRVAGLERIPGLRVRFDGETGTWSTLSAELAPTHKMTTEEAAELLTNAVLGEPLPPTQAGSGPETCGVVDCRACKFVEESSLEETVPRRTEAETKPYSHGDVRSEGMDW